MCTFGLDIQIVLLEIEQVFRKPLDCNFSKKKKQNQTLSNSIFQDSYCFVTEGLEEEGTCKLVKGKVVRPICLKSLAPISYVLILSHIIWGGGGEEGKREISSGTVFPISVPDRMRDPYCKVRENQEKSQQFHFRQLLIVLLGGYHT